MRRKKLLVWALAITSLAFACESAAKPQQYLVDKNHSRIVFFVNHFGYSNLPGIFRDFDVDLSYDRDDPAKSSFSVTILAASVDMFNERLNEHLKKEDFFDAARYPTITFASTSVQSVAKGEVRVTGDLTLLGQTHPVTFDVKLNKDAPNPMTHKPAAGFDAKGRLDRTEFGMKKYAPMVSAEVEFIITLEARLAEK